MRIVIDSNRVLAAMIKDSTTREILLYPFFEFVAPEFLKEEIVAHKNRILKASGISEDEFEILFEMIFENITIIPQTECSRFMTLAEENISDPKDAPYLAACMASKSEGVWTHDPHFKK